MDRPSIAIGSSPVRKGKKQDWTPVHLGILTAKLKEKKDYNDIMAALKEGPHGRPNASKNEFYGLLKTREYGNSMATFLRKNRVTKQEEVEEILKHYKRLEDLQKK